MVPRLDGKNKWRLLAVAPIAALFLTSCTASGQVEPNRGAVFPIQGKVATPMNLNVLTIDESIALMGDPTIAAQYAGRPCPVRDTSADLVGGQVRVSDSHGVMVALGKVDTEAKMIAVPGGLGTSLLACELSFTVGAVPDTDLIYTVQLSRLPGVSFTREQLSGPVDMSAL
ncbi:hypothetical protein [Knoellia sp. Soil729]|uniref:hypothetical protein n=1 Tax=Knoellia sp. Soil729 TaxID=1736394 RepID=UPI000A9BDAEA|nr:hypothetical protein [Knoellia sp. Soil729]